MGEPKGKKKELGKVRSDFYYEVSKLFFWGGAVVVAEKGKVGATFLIFLSFYRI